MDGPACFAYRFNFQRPILVIILIVSCTAIASNDINCFSCTRFLRSMRNYNPGHLVNIKKTVSNVAMQINTTASNRRIRAVVHVEFARKPIQFQTVRGLADDPTRLQLRADPIWMGKQQQRTQAESASLRLVAAQSTLN